MMPEHFLIDSDLPTLKVVTRPLPTGTPFNSDTVTFTDPVNPLFWFRNGSGLIGSKEAFRLHFFGEDRFKHAAKVWELLTQKAVVDDTVNAPGTGLTAFASFTFDANSKRESVIVVPQKLLGKMQGTIWETTITAIYESVSNNETGHVNPVAIGNGPIASFYEPQGEARAYRDGVQEASRRIANGEAEKIVLARRLQSALPHGDLRFALKNLAEKYTDCWTFAVDGMLGSSPETLIRSVSGEVTARVLAGTRKRALDKDRDERMKNELLESEKEQFEHELAVASLTETLSPYVTDLTVEKDPHILKLPNVWHLATDVSARLVQGAGVIELAGAVHPTAAVAGTPTPVAIENIAELEPFDRERYAGAVGWIDANGDGDFAIALRSAQVDGVGDDRTITAFAGGGLVAGSDPWHELTETIAKFRPIIEAFS